MTITICKCGQKEGLCVCDRQVEQFGRDGWREAQ